MRLELLEWFINEPKISKSFVGTSGIGRLELNFANRSTCLCSLLPTSSSSSSYRCYCYCWCWLSRFAIVLVELIHCIMFGCGGEGCDGHKERIKFDLDSQCKSRDAILARLWVYSSLFLFLFGNSKFITFFGRGTTETD